MQFDISTLALISALTMLGQFVALFVQYMVNRSSRAGIWWMLGAAIWALGVILMPMISIPALSPLARIANPLVVLGQIFLYTGVLRFLDKRENDWRRVLLFLGFLFFYYFYMFVSNAISARTVAVSAVMGLFSFMTAYRLFSSKDRWISFSAGYTAIIFLVYGCFSFIRICAVFLSPPIQSYADQRIFLELSFVVPILASLLWTFGFIIMQNQRLNAENREEKEKLQLIFHTGPNAAVISRLTDGWIIDINAGFIAMSGYSRAELVENSTIRINIWHNPSDRDHFVNELIEKGVCENREYVFQRKDGSLLTGSISAKIVNLKTVPHIVSIVHDITQRKRAEEAMRESEELYRSILNASPDDITITDMQGRILVVSPAAKKMFGFEPDYDHFIGTQLLDYIVPEDRERAKCNIQRMLKSNYAGPNEYRGVRNDKSIIDIEVNSGPIMGANQQPSKMVFIVRDITGRKQNEQQINRLVQQLEIEKKAAQLNANTDSMTGLANRRYFDEILELEFYRLQRSGRGLSLIMLDVDHFKKFNDQYGHLAGDECLRRIATTIKSCVRRATDVVARYGGEEFVIILPETDLKGTSDLAEQIRQAVEALAIPHEGSNVSEYVTVSLGVVTVTPPQINSPDQIVALADTAMYCAKKDGRNRCSFNPDVIEERPHR